MSESTNERCPACKSRRSSKGTVYLCGTAPGDLRTPLCDALCRIAELTAALTAEWEKREALLSYVERNATVRSKIGPLHAMGWQDAMNAVKKHLTPTSGTAAAQPPRTP